MNCTIPMKKMKNIHYNSIYFTIIHVAKWTDEWKNKQLSNFEQYINPMPEKVFMRMIGTPTIFIDYIRNKYKPSINTIKAIAELIMFICKEDKTLKKRIIVIKSWEAMYSIINSIYTDVLKSKTDAALKMLKDNNCSLENFKKIRDTCSVADPLRLLIDLYVLMPPARADYGNLMIYKEKPEKPESTSYVIPTLDSTIENPSYEIHVTEYKTVKTYGERILKCCSEFNSDLNEILTLNSNSRYLFHKPGKNECYSPKRFSEFVKNIMRRVVPGGITINSLRKLYCSTHGNNFEEMNQLALDLGHSLKTHINNYMSITTTDFLTNLTKENQLTITPVPVDDEDIPINVNNDSSNLENWCKNLSQCWTE
ncbi:hypothetical protein WA158_003038 [Blastocystis sp. Blastoise]